jgi:hypothetical protein
MIIITNVTVNDYTQPVRKDKKYANGKSKKEKQAVEL